MSNMQAEDKPNPLGAIVELNVYDLTPPDNPESVPTINWYLYPVGFGVYHSGVSVYNSEYCFGGHEQSSTGIFAVRPRHAPDARYRQTLFIGRTHLTRQQVRELIQDMSAVWLGNSYNLFTRNCNHFASDLCERLTGSPAPDWVNRLAWLADKAKAFLPEGFDTGESPVSAPSGTPTATQTHDDSDPDHDA